MTKMFSKLKSLLVTLLVLGFTSSLCSCGLNNSSSSTSSSSNIFDSSSSSEKEKTYIVTWVNYDDSVLETDFDIPYGTMPSYDGETPTRPENNQCSYKFIGWTPKIHEVQADIVYKAKFEEVYNLFTITWLNYDRSVLEVDNDLRYGEEPHYDGETPSRESTAQYSYKWTGWTPKITKVKSDTEYVATFEESIQKYSVTWKYNDNIIKIDESILYGTRLNSLKPIDSITGINNGIESTLLGWDYDGDNKVDDLNEIIVDRNMTITAIVDKKVQTFTVTWVNYDNSILEVDKDVPYGTTPKYDGNTPIRDDDQYDYTWTGWTPEVTSVVSDITYKATYSSKIKTFTVTWVNYDNSILEIDEEVPYGTTPSFNGAEPSKPSDDQYSYTWSGWDKEITAVKCDITYKATFLEHIKKYTITWLNYDDSVLEVDNNVKYGTMPTYDSETPFKENSGGYAYHFAGWSPKVSEVTGDATYKATFTSSILTYTVSWLNYDGTILELDEAVPHGTVPTYNEETPTKNSIGLCSFTFNGWDKEIEPVTNNISYKATYTESVNCVIGDGVLVIENFDDVTDISKDSIKAVYILNGNTSVPSTFFEDCTSLETLYMPDSIKSFNYCAFGGCSNLKTIYWNATECSFFPSGTMDPFYNCPNIENFVIGDNVISLPSNLMRNCDSLESLNITRNVSYIGNNAFAECDNLSIVTVDENNTKFDSRENSNVIIETETNTIVWAGSINVNIPSSVTDIADYAFEGNTSIGSIYIPEGITKIGYGIFSNCALLSSIVVSENNTKYDSRNNSNAIIETETNTLVSGCQTTTIPSNIKRIEEAAFYKCSLLSNLIIPDSVKTIGIWAFEHCKNLTNVTLPNDLKVIEDFAFYGCENLASIELPNVTNINVGAFGHCGFETITLPSSLKNIINSAFYGCPNLVTIINNSSLVLDDETLLLEDVTIINSSSPFSNEISSFNYDISKYPFFSNSDDTEYDTNEMEPVMEVIDTMFMYSNYLLSYEENMFFYYLNEEIIQSVRIWKCSFIYMLDYCESIVYSVGHRYGHKCIQFVFMKGYSYQINETLINGEPRGRIMYALDWTL